jgi:hypothetical protein
MNYWYGASGRRQNMCWDFAIKTNSDFVLIAAHDYFGNWGTIGVNVVVV